jgi:nitrate/nitrite transporter NarK
MYLPEDVVSASMVQRRVALQNIIYIFCGITILAGLLIWLVVPRRHRRSNEKGADRIQWDKVGNAVRNPALWYQAVIVVCAYVGYKSTDDFSLYARDVLNYDDVGAARVGTVTFWVRPVAAVLAGLIADRISASKVVLFGFAIMGTGTMILASGVIKPGLEWLLMLSIVYSGLGIYALRGVYFAMTAEARIPISVTGTAIGIVSMIGFLPDVFFGPLMGFLLDSSPGPKGHADVFAVVCLFAVVGAVASVLFRRTLSAGADTTTNHA